MSIPTTYKFIIANEYSPVYHNTYVQRIGIKKIFNTLIILIMVEWFES